MTGSIELLQAERRLGTILKDKYRLDRVLGVGGMAVVYAATHRNRRAFAIKMLHAELSVIEELRVRFQREGYAANMVEHPGTVAVLDDDVTEDGAAFIVMELLRGTPLDVVARNCGGCLPIPEALGLVHQLLDVLSAAHVKGIIHRDIKPANLFLDTGGQLKVLDFGIARIRDVTASHLATGIGTTLGTPAFMAPEQALGNVNEIDARTDLWAAGATLFTLISGHLVHEGETAQQLLVYAATRPARSLGSVLARAPQSLVDLTARSLAFDNADRFATASEMQHEVERVSKELFGALASKEHLAPLASSTDRDPSLLPTEQSGPPPAPISGSARPPSIAPRRTGGPVSVTANGTAGNRGTRTTVIGASFVVAGALAAAAFHHFKSDDRDAERPKPPALAHEQPGTPPTASDTPHRDPRPDATQDEQKDDHSSGGAAGASGSSGHAGHYGGSGGRTGFSHPHSGGTTSHPSTASTGTSTGEEQHNPLAMPIK